MELKRIVNIMPDEKFLDYYIEMSEQFIPDQSSYLVFKNTSILNFIKSKNKNLSIIPDTLMFSEDLINSLKNSDKIIFHSFRREYKKFIEDISGSVELIWLFWGFDGYITQKNRNYLGDITAKLRFKKSSIGYLRYIKNKIYNDRIVSKVGRDHLSIIKMMDYCATWVEADIDLAREINPELKHLYFNYYTEELMDFPSGHSINLNLQTLMLGNSGSEYNNHAEALLYLKEINFTGKIYCPLSYNGTEHYKANIIKLGNDLFGKNFVAMQHFVSLKEYQNIVNSCDVVWMNHKRQQAAGNIFSALCMGKVVILDPINPMISTFKKWGMKTYTKEVLINKLIDGDDLKKNTNIKNLLNFNANLSFFDFLINRDEQK